MRHMLYTLCLLLLAPSVTHAAYQDPTIITNERYAEGGTKVIFRFNGTAGEPAVTRAFVIGRDTTAVAVRHWVDATIKELDLLQTAAGIPALQSGATVPRLAPEDPLPSARDIWERKVSIYAHLAPLGFTGALAADLAVMKADIQATYQSGYLNAR